MLRIIAIWDKDNDLFTGYYDPEQVEAIFPTADGCCIHFKSGIRKSLNLNLDGKRDADKRDAYMDSIADMVNEKKDINIHIGE